MKFRMSNKVYDFLKTLCTIFLPAVAALYSSLSEIWGLPFAKEIVGTLAALDLFIGAVIGISSATYMKEKGEDEVNG